MIVTSATSKIDVVLYDLSESGFKRRISVGEMVGKSRKKMVSLSNGLFPPKEDKR